VEVVSAGEQLRRLLAEAGATESSALAAAARAAKVEGQLHTHVTRLEKVGHCTVVGHLLKDADTIRDLLFGPLPLRK
jgi:hypothetical protein